MTEPRKTDPTVQSGAIFVPIAGVAVGIIAAVLGLGVIGIALSVFVIGPALAVGLLWLSLRKKQKTRACDGTDTKASQNRSDQKDVGPSPSCNSGLGGFHGDARRSGRAIQKAADR